MEDSTREHQRYYIFVSWKNGKLPSQIHKELQDLRHYHYAQFIDGLKLLRRVKMILNIILDLDILAKLSHEEQLLKSKNLLMNIHIYQLGL